MVARHPNSPHRPSHHKQGNKQFFPLPPSLLISLPTTEIRKEKIKGSPFISLKTHHLKFPFSSSPSPIQPPPSSPPPTTTFLSLLPAAILDLTAALSPQDKEVLAYLISCCDRSDDAAANRNKASRKTTTAGSGDNKKRGAADENHGPTFECSCFRCYVSFWARWNASSNRHVIHEIIDGYEEAALTCQHKRRNRKRESAGKKRFSVDRQRRLGKEGELMGPGVTKPESAEQLPSSDASYEEDGRSGDGDDVDSEKSTVRKIVSFVGDRIIGIFGGI